MARKKHPRAAIEEAVRYAEKNGWRVVPAGKSAHAWAILECPAYSKACRCGVFCRNSIWSTPRDADIHANAIRRWVKRCIYFGGGDG
ncbi:MAG: hypothetical protein LAT61_15655 [Alcanivorax sp.]|nr:hypothetical protein [Alcanivorax sp.]